jgi:hypothetical protein
MAGRRFCVVGPWCDEKLFSSPDCSAHAHLTWREINELWTEGFLEPLRPANAPRPKDEPDYLLRWLIPGRVVQYMRKIPIRGLSCKIGPEHVQALKEKESWAVAMLRQIQMRREPLIITSARVEV